MGGIMGFIVSVLGERGVIYYVFSLKRFQCFPSTSFGDAKEGFDFPLRSSSGVSQDRISSTDVYC